MTKAKRQQKSKVWLHFQRQVKNDEHAKCMKCDAIVSCKGGNTSVMRKHLKAIHDISLGTCTVFDCLRKAVPSSTAATATEATAQPAAAGEEADDEGDDEDDAVASSQSQDSESQG